MTPATPLASVAPRLRRAFPACAPLLALALALAGAREGAAAAGAAEGGPGAPACVYRWKPKAIYRYQLRRHTEVAREQPPAQSQARVTDLRAVLVLEVESVGAEGDATGTLRLDSPLLVLPPYEEYNSETGLVETDQARSLALAKSLVDILGSMRWKVQVYAGGAVRVEGKSPLEGRDWLPRAEQAGKWRRKSTMGLTALMEGQLNLCAGGLDELLLPVFSEPSGKVEAPFDALRPARRVQPGAAGKDGKCALASERFFATPASPGQALAVPYLNPAEPAVRLIPGKVRNTTGQGVYDRTLGLLDSFQEKYAVELTCQCEDAAGKSELRQVVSVDYRLLRLMPPLREADAEAPATAP